MGLENLWEITMSECECLVGCPFFHDRMPIESGLGIVYKMNYCIGDFTKCARHIVVQVLGKERVPADLYPNQQARVAEIIAGS
jgi:hypothetical protein